MSDPIVEPTKENTAGAISSVLKPVMEMCESVTKRVKSIKELEGLLNKATDASGMEEAQVVGVVIAVLVLLVFLISGFSLIAILVAWVYPMYRSCQAVRDNKDSEKWLKYWVMYGIVNFVLYFTDFAISWFPMYGLLKVGLYIGLWHPSVNGADVLFEHVVEKVFLKVGSD